MKLCKITIVVIVCSLLAGCQQAVQVEGIPFVRSWNEGWGIMDTEGEIVVSAGSYAGRPSPVVNGRYTVMSADSLLQLYDIAHPYQPLSLRKFVQVGYFFDKVTVAQEQEGMPFLLIDRNGQTVSVLDDGIVEAHNFYEGRALVKTAQGKYGYVDIQGKWVIPPVYSEASDFSEGKAVVGISDRHGKTGFQVIDTKGKVLFTLQYLDALYVDRYTEGMLLLYSQAVRQWSYLDDEGHTYLCLPDSTCGVLPFERGVAVVASKSGYGLMGRQGETLLPYCYREVQVVADKRAVVRKNGQWNLYDWEKEQCLFADLDTVPFYFSSGWGVAKKDSTCFWIDRNGQRKDKEIYCSLWADAEALRMRSQVFIRRNNLRNGLSSLSVKEIKDTLDEKKNINRLPMKERLAGKKGIRISTSDWRKVARSNPFYEEAMKVVSGHLEEDDAANRRMILDYVEHLRTSYITRDIDFLDQLFSEDALIIVGAVVYSLPQGEESRVFRNQVRYSVKSKRTYLECLREVFRKNRDIDLQFNDFRIMRHPSVSDIYGVTLHQKYHSDSYSDDGYLFLLWDFRDRTAPKIHVRTWQPGLQEGMIPLPESEIININQFNLN